MGLIIYSLLSISVKVNCQTVKLINLKKNILKMRKKAKKNSCIARKKPYISLTYKKK